MTSFIRRIALLTAGMTCAMAQAAATDEKWEMTTRMDMPGFQMPPTTTTVCIPKDGAYQPDRDKRSNCQVSDLKVAGNKVSWKVRCTGKDEMTGVGEQTRTASTMSGTIRITAQGTTMNQSYTGKLLGNCDAKAESGAAVTVAGVPGNMPAGGRNSNGRAGKPAPAVPAEASSQPPEKSDLTGQSLETAKQLKGLLGL